MVRTNAGVLIKSLDPVTFDICQHIFDLIGDILDSETSFESAGPADHEDSCSLFDEIKACTTITFHLREDSE